MNSANPILTISIATWNSRALVGDCLTSIRAHSAGVPTEIVVVDNASSDGTAARIRAEFPEACLIENARPFGFSANHNQVLRRAGGKYILLLNDDTAVLEGALARAVEFMEAHSEAGAVGCTLLRPDGVPERISQRLPHPLDPLWPGLRRKTGPHLNEREREYDCETSPVEVERWSGAALLLRRETLDQVGLLDERFDPAYGEDTDLCYRITQAGWRIYRLPDAPVIHLRGRTAKREFGGEQARRLQAAKFRWYRKHRSRAQLYLYKAAVLVVASGEIAFNFPQIALPRRRDQAKGKLAHAWARVRACFAASS